MAQELNIHLETDSSTPLYRQIYEYIRGEIRNGSLAADERLPSTRALASYLQVARSTTELAYSQLVMEGYLTSKPNSGYYINEIFYGLERSGSETSPSDDESTTIGSST